MILGTSFHFHFLPLRHVQYTVSWRLPSSKQFCFVTHCFDVEVDTVGSIFRSSFFFKRRKQTTKWITIVGVFSETTQCCIKWSLLEHLCGWITAVICSCTIWSCVKSLNELCLLSVHTDVNLLVCLWCSEVYMSENDHNVKDMLLP